MPFTSITTWSFYDIVWIINLVPTIHLSRVMNDRTSPDVFKVQFAYFTLEKINAVNCAFPFSHRIESHLAKISATIA